VSVVLQRSEQALDITEDKRMKPDIMDLIISSMDSEWDEECAKLLLCYGKTRGELSHLCFNVDKLLSKKSTVINVATEIAQTKMTAQDLVILRLQDKEKSLNDKISQKATAIQQFGQSWLPYVKEDKEAEIEALKEQVTKVQEIQVCIMLSTNNNISDECNVICLGVFGVFTFQEHNSNTSKQKFKQMVKRTADHLDEHCRLKRR
jgi:hypothetical protein